MDDGLIQNGFDEFLADVEAHGLLTLSERRKVNHAGAKVYENHMKAFLDSHKSTKKYKDGTNHLAETLTHEIKDDGHYEIGFSNKGKKAYIARFLNDGWDSKNQFGGPYRHVQPADWHDFISRIGTECDKEMGEQMAAKANELIHKRR